jgi:DNA repair exonuclease SbcCD ATPase subunit
MEQQPESSAGEMMVFGLIEQADRMGKSAQGTQRALTEQIQELAQLQEWTVKAAIELQKRADASIQKLEAERAQLQAARTNLERHAVQAIQGAVAQQSAEIERQIVRAFAAPLRDIQQAAAQVRQNIKEASWLTIGLVFAGGMLLGFMVGYWPLHSSQANMQEQLNRIEQYLVARQPTASTPTAPDAHAPVHKGKAK